MNIKIKNIQAHIEIERSKYTLMLFVIILTYTYSNGQSLTAYKKEAQQNNPEIKAVEKVYQSNQEQLNIVADIANTKVSSGYFVSGPQTRTGEQKVKFSAMQELPWFGTLKAKKQTRIAQNEIDKNNIEIIKRKVFYGIEKQYYKLYKLKAKQKVLLQQDSLLQKYMDIALTEVQNNRASAVDVLKLTIAKNNLFDQQEILKGTILSEEDTMNQLLHRDGFDPLLIPDNLYIPDEEPTMMLDDITFHPELLTYDHTLEVLDKKERTNTKEHMPSIGVGVDYVIVEERPDMSFVDNGKDIVMPKISFSIPLFTKKYSARTKQYEIQKEETSYRRDAVQNTLENLLEQAINNRITARINYDTQQKNIRQTNELEKLLLSKYQTSILDFEELLDIQQMLLNFEHRKIEAIATYFLNTATLNYLR